MDKDKKCPWTKLTDISVLEVKATQRPIKHKLVLPGSKSISNRVLLLAALGDQPCELTGVLKSEDTYWMSESLKLLGVKITVNQSSFRVDGQRFLRGSNPVEIYVGSAGTAARFFPGVLAAREGPTLMYGSDQLTRRPISTLVNGLQELGAEIEAAGSAQTLPLKIRGGGFNGGSIQLSGRQSSQFISGMLIAAPLSREGVQIHVPDDIVQSDYVKITMHYMEKFGVQVNADQSMRHFAVRQQKYKATDLSLEADASTATYFFALAALTGGEIEILNLGTETTQPDYGFVDILERMGCGVIKKAYSTKVKGPEKLTGGFDVDMKPLSDATLTLAALAPYADNPIHIHNVQHIRHHESDRINVVCKHLSAMGIRVEERVDGLSIYPGTPHKAEIDPYEDHRVAMAMALIGTKSGIRIKDPFCVSKTCPDYFDILSSMGMKIDTKPSSLLST